LFLVFFLPLGQKKGGRGSFSLLLFEYSKSKNPHTQANKIKQGRIYKNAGG